VSVINQVLLDLEKRRASGAERGALPSQVRALPEGERAGRWRWIAAAGGLALAAGLGGGAWALLSGLEVTRWSRPAPVAERPAGEAAVEKGVAISTGATGDVKRRAGGAGAVPEAPASLASLELSGAPAATGAKSASEPAPAAGGWM